MSPRTPLITVLLAGALAVAAAAAPPAAASPTSSATAQPAGGSRTVSFAGASIQVPVGWPVIDVDGVPGCVRHDRHAVYLGEPSETTCPARIVGQTATVQILRPGPAATAAAQASRRAHANPVAVAAGAAGPVALSTGTAGPVVLIGAGGDDVTAATIAASTRIDGARPAIPAPLIAPHTVATGPTTASGTQAPPSPAVSAPAPVATGTGLGFDACYPPTLRQLDAWQGSPYTTIGAYIGGANYACAPAGAPSNLTASWVSGVAARGWHLLPVYVGLQPPCSGFTKTMSTVVATARTQGTAASTDAIQLMRSLGLGAGNPVYLDMEAWKDGSTGACTKAVMAFTDAWTVGLHAAGYVSGFYSSAAAGIPQLVYTVQHDTTFHAPDAVWFARWDGQAVTTDPNIPSTLWPNHQRAKQYQGDVYQTFGGLRLNIDTDAVDGPVTASSPALATTSLPAAVPNKAYSAQLTVRGGVGPYRFSVTGGSLPAGLTLAPSGKITGATNVVGTGSVTFTVTDASSARASATYPTAVTFTDVPTTSAFFPDIAWLANAKITNGYPDGTFGPTSPVIRQSMAAFLYRYANPGAAAPACSVAPFPDVPTTNPFCGEITWLKSTGITGGYTDGTFRPADVVNRGSMAAFLYRLTHGGADAGPCTTPSAFGDVPAGSAFCGDIAWLASTKITIGYSDGTYRPGAAVLRQEMAAFLHRLSALPS